MAKASSDYNALMQYPANPYITPKSSPIPPDWPTYNLDPNTVQQGVAAGLTAQPGNGGQGAQQGQAGQPGSGWWTGPNYSLVTSPYMGQDFANAMYSPNLLGGIENMYGWMGDAYKNLPSAAGAWKGEAPGSLADLYRQQMGQNAQFEQQQYNQALSRLKGQYGTGLQGLATLAGARRGGIDSGGYQAGLTDLNKGLMSGTKDIAIQQAMQNMAQQEARTQALLGYSQQDIANRQGWLQGMTGAMGQDVNARLGTLGQYGGWLQSMIPYEQYNIETPRNWANEAASAKWQQALAQESINAGRRREGMDMLGMLMGYGGQDAQNYYGGQQNWLNYLGNRGQANLGGYSQNWLGYLGL